MMIVELWLASGMLARGVVLLLIGMSVAAGAAATAAWLRMRRAEQATAACMTKLAAARVAGGGMLTAGKDAAIAAAHPLSPVAALIARVLEARRPRGGSGGELHDRLVRAQVLATGESLRGGLGIIATVGSTAPFVGLFGTVLGIIDAFSSMGESGRGGIAVVSTGIAEALVTTALGILVAIPAVWLFNHLSQRAARMLGVIERAGEELAIEGLVAPGPASVSALPSASERRASWA
jgi:biopolymer transport protein ExbB/TolQ